MTCQVKVGIFNNMNKFFISIASLLLLSCASDIPDGKTQAEVLFKEANLLKEDGRFILATEKLNQLKNEHPYSFYAVPAELLLADILYEQENFVESAAAYIIFRDFHPKNEKAAYVTFKIAESFYKQIPETTDRDLDSAIEAIKYYKELIANYPNSEYIKDSNDKIKKCQDMVIDKEKNIADFYFKTESYKAAMWRYKYILENVKDIEIVRHSMLRLIQSSFYSNNFQECLHYSKNFIPLFQGPKMDEALNFQNKCKEFLNKGLKND